MKNLFNILILILINFYSDAQVFKSIGVKGGTSIANQVWVNGSHIPLSSGVLVDTDFNKDEKKNKVGFYGAFSLEFFNSKIFSFVTDIGYCEKGARYDFNYFDIIPKPKPSSPPDLKLIHAQFTSSSIFFQVEPLLKSRIGIKSFIFYSLIGLRADYLYSVHGNDDYARIRTFGKKFIRGKTIGLGVEYKINKFGINAELKFQNDFDYAADYPHPLLRNTSYYKFKNNAQILSAGIAYCFTKENTKKELQFPPLSQIPFLKSIGFKSGISLANQIWASGSSIPGSSNTSISADFNSDEKKNRIGYYGSLSFDFFDFKNLSLVFDLNYCEKGARYDFTYYYFDPFGPAHNGGYYHSSFTSSTVYFQLEPLIKYSHNFHRLDIYSLLGLRTDVLISYYGTNTFPDFKNHGNRIILGATAGSGIEYRKKRIGFGPEIKFQYDITNAANYYMWGISHYRVKNIAFIFNAGIKYYFQAKESPNQTRE